MALIVEDGTIIASADSYISLEDARTYAANYGYTLPADDTDAEVALRNGAIYIGLYEDRFSGTRVGESQELSWPREDAEKYGNDISETTIPAEVQRAQVIAASRYGAGTDVRPDSDGQSIQSEEIAGVLKQSYFNTGKNDANITIQACEDMLEPLFDSGSSDLVSFEVNR